ncbi:hypothetical protein CF54_13515 [Streptomyces sp. Tu 6176]|nr:hypothetical protein CF54_13515 [Streptomyces sp. Tu 6176]
MCGRLPRPGRRTLADWRRRAAEGPPGEEVGLEPFAPPEYLAAAGPSPAHRPPAPEPLPTGESR